MIKCLNMKWQVKKLYAFQFLLKNYHYFLNNLSKNYNSFITLILIRWNPTFILKIFNKLNYLTHLLMILIFIIILNTSDILIILNLYLLSIVKYIHQTWFEQRFIRLIKTHSTHKYLNHLRIVNLKYMLSLLKYPFIKPNYLKSQIVISYYQI